MRVASSSVGLDSHNLRATVDVIVIETATEAYLQLLLVRHLSLLVSNSWIGGMLSVYRGRRRRQKGLEGLHKGRSVIYMARRLR